MATAAVAATCAACMINCQFGPPPMAFSGTTTISPGCKTLFMAFPMNNPLELELITVPSARITNAAPLFASCVGPPACERYHLALLLGR